MKISARNVMKLAGKIVNYDIKKESNMPDKNDEKNNQEELTNNKTEDLRPAPVKKLKPEEIRKLSAQEKAEYYGALMVEGLNDLSNHDKSN